MNKLNQTNEPILLKRGAKIEAALVPIELFRQRFVDMISEDEIQTLRARIRARRVKPKSNDSLQVLRRLRGYDK
ncbi:MAG: hypothetical protein JW841_09940 [Deltaproteobacteria bacterium]|nr:hypothetical protein [Deltaproteobacteria bacterium]